MTAQAATVGGGLGPVVARLEELPPAELEAQYEELRRQAGQVRHMNLVSLLAAARALDWAPGDASGAFDLTPGSALAVETLCDRLPVNEREGIARLFAFAVAHRLHDRTANAPYVLPEIAPDPERMRDPKATWTELTQALKGGALSRALHAWPCCLARTPWSQVTELAAELALSDGATLGARVVAAHSIRRVLEIQGREHRHPIITALWRALAALPRGEDPSALQVQALGAAGEQADVHRHPQEGAAVDVVRLAAELYEHEKPEQLAGARLAAGDAAGGVLDAVALAACERALALEGADADLTSWVAETLVIVNCLREIDGREDHFLRPRAVVEAARLLGARTSLAAARGACWRDSNLGPASDATVEALAAAVAAGDARGAAARAAVLAAEPRRAVEVVRILDSRTPFDPRDLTPLRFHVAAVDEYRRSEGAPAARFLAAAAASAAATGR